MIITEKQLDETDKSIILRIKEGKTYKEIARLIYISVPAIKQRIRAMKDRSDCKTLPELICKLGNI